MRGTVFKQLAVNMPMITHKGTAPESCSLVIPAFLPSVRFYRCGESFFNTHMIDPYSASIGFWLNPPVGTHFLDGRVGYACVISTFYTWKSYSFLHSYSPLSALLNLHISKFTLFMRNHVRYQLIIVNRLMICKSCVIIKTVVEYA